MFVGRPKDVGSSLTEQTKRRVSTEQKCVGLAAPMNVGGRIQLIADFLHATAIETPRGFRPTLNRDRAPVFVMPRVRNTSIRRRSVCPTRS